MASKVRDIIRRLRRDGWMLVSIEGDHRHFKYPTKPGKVTVAGGDERRHAGGDMGKSIQRQAGWRGQ